MTRTRPALLCCLALAACRAAPSPCPSGPAALAPAASPAAPPPAATQPATAERARSSELPELPRLTGEQALRDLRIAERALTELHPGIDRYLTRAGLAAQLATLRAELADGTDLGGMMLAISRLTAAVRCGHTWTNPLNQPARVRRALEDRADKLPMYLRLVEGRLLVLASADAAITAGAELLAIDERTPAQLVRELWPYLRADGNSDGKRLIQLDHGEGGDALDRLLPLLHPPAQGRYQLRWRSPGGELVQRVVHAITSAERAQRLAAAGWREPSEAWTFEITGDTAILTLPTFAFWDGAFDWRGFLARSFAELQRRAVPYLILDQRRNEGGNGAIVDAILRELLAAPYRKEARRAEVAYERVPYDLARFLDTWDFAFFDHTGKVATQPGRNLRYVTASSKAGVVRPGPRPFRGRTFALIGPANSSAGFLLAAALKRSGAATLVGQATGGNQRGLNGGELAWITLPESGVSFDVPLVAWMPPGAPPDAGIAPDLAVAPTFAQAAAGVDAELSFTLAEIARLRAAADVR